MRTCAACVKSVDIGISSPIGTVAEAAYNLTRSLLGNLAACTTLSRPLEPCTSSLQPTPPAATQDRLIVAVPPRRNCASTAAVSGTCGRTTPIPGTCQAARLVVSSPTTSRISPNKAVRNVMACEPRFRSDDAPLGLSANQR